METLDWKPVVNIVTHMNIYALDWSQCGHLGINFSIFYNNKNIISFRLKTIVDTEKLENCEPFSFYTMEVPGS